MTAAPPDDIPVARTPPGAIPSRRRPIRPSMLIGAGVLIMMIVIVTTVFAQIPIEGTAFGIDWHGMWTSLQNGHIVYSNAHDSALMNPPWTVLMLVPLGFLSFRASWGLLSLFTLAVIVLSIPRLPRARRQPRLLPLLLLIVSWPLLREIADGNLEGLIIGGACLIIAALDQENIGWLALGILLITAKVQESWLLLIGVGAYLLLNWPVIRWGRAAGLTLLIVIPTMLWAGGLWIHTVLTMPTDENIVFMNWQATLSRLLIPGWLITITWIGILAITLASLWISRRTFDRPKAGALIAASLLLAPYAAANSILSVLAVGVIPLFQRRTRLGLLLILLCDAPILLPAAVQYAYGADFATLTVLILWGALTAEGLIRSRSAETVPA